ncbi:MAG: polyprenol monophosphomannose synthase [Ornithinimicrobium sp.]
MTERSWRPLAPDQLCILLPTYNERESLPLMVARLQDVVPHAQILVIDDASPDGTGRLADELASTHKRVNVLHREAKDGLGRAYVAGFGWAVEHGFTAVVQIDADGSHQPEELPSLVAAAARADLVIGSRWVPGGSVRNWALHRRALSLGGNLFVRLALGIPVRDATAGFRIYRVDALRAMGVADIASAGYCFQVDLTLRAVDRGLVVREVPIEFVERVQGVSKMGTSIVAEALVRVSLWGVERRIGQLHRRLHRANHR